MGRPASRKRILLSEVLPDDLLHVIFSKLHFRDKVIAGHVCKHWDQLLKSGTAAARHWVVSYDLDAIIETIELERTPSDPPVFVCVFVCVHV
jgi:hypothetical protein